MIGNNRSLGVYHPTLLSTCYNCVTLSTPAVSNGCSSFNLILVLHLPDMKKRGKVTTPLLLREAESPTVD